MMILWYSITNFLKFHKYDHFYKQFMEFGTWFKEYHKHNLLMEFHKQYGIHGIL